MESFQRFLDSELAQGKSFFTKTTALTKLAHSPEAFDKAVMRFYRKGLVVSPRRGFYLILRPEDRVLGAPDPAKWIDPLMNYVGVDYRISLLRAAAFHGSSHQAAMVFQVIAPRQLPKIEIGRQRVEFVFQEPVAFGEVNRPEWLRQLKTDAGYARMAGIELTLLDTCRYFHRAGGIDGAAQVVHDIGKGANPRVLAKAAKAYENSSVRRLGYLLDRFGHHRQAISLRRFAERAKSYKALDPSLKPILAELGGTEAKDLDWKLIVNWSTEVEV